MADAGPPHAVDQLPSRPDPGLARVVLVIGRADDAALAQAGALGGRMIVSAFPTLNAALLDRLAPDCVIFPLIASSFDALQVIERLAEMGYRGQACVMAPHLPNRRMVEAELRSHGPGLRLVLIEHHSRR